MQTNIGADTKTQKKILLEYLRTHKGATRGDMFWLGIANGPEIIRRLKMDGHVIQGEKETTDTDKVCTRYWLIKERKDEQR